MSPKKIIILGGEFRNKGAEAMTFATVNELKRMFINAEIVMLNHLEFEQKYVDKLNFRVVRLSEEQILYSLGLKDKLYALAKWAVKSILIGHQEPIRAFAKELKTADIVMDISGYALSSQLYTKHSRMFLKKIQAADKYKCKSVLMPQSFGPFAYNGEITEEEIAEILAKVQIIFAREKQGYDLLKNLGLNNIIMSNDLVIQSRKMEEKFVFKDNMKCEEIDVQENSVAVIPNIRNVQNSSEEKTIELYRQVIDELVRLEKKVYLISHCSEDQELIEKIRIYYPDVYVIEKELNCIEYERAIKKFDYVIASRYHSIIHAYKEHVPCIVIGWATKYQELVANFEQDRYIFDIRKDCTGIVKAIDELNDQYKDETEKIACCLEKVQRNNCFDILKKYFNEIEE